MRRRFIPIILFVAYAVFLIKVMVFKSMPTVHVGQVMLNFSGTELGHPANFVPFKTILPYLLGYKGWIIAGINLAGNILPLIPIGFLLPLISKRMTWKKALLLSFVTALAIETMQVLLDVGIFDIDDVILNVLGVMIGFWAFIVLMRWIRAKKYIHIAATVLIAIALAWIAVRAVIPTNQPVILPGNEVSQNGDPCGGTGGTGEIISKEDHSITIKRNDGVAQTFAITEKTTIETAAGPAKESDLKIGERVTLVVYDNKTASGVFVCAR